MLAIGSALACAPELLLVDELSQGLAPLVVEELLHRLQAIRKDLGMTLLLVEQNAAVALGVADYAYVLENGRIVLMFCAFDGRPNIVRLHGDGRYVLRDTDEWNELIGRFGEHNGARAIIVVDVKRVADSCGWAVPTMAFQDERTILDLGQMDDTQEQLTEYRKEKNAVSLDGLPGLD